MYSYAILEPECYYLVQFQENGPLILIQVRVISDFGMYVVRYENELTMQWVRKTDPIFDIVELLSDEVAQKWLSVYSNNEETYYGGGGNEMDDDL